LFIFDLLVRGFLITMYRFGRLALFIKQGESLFRDKPHETENRKQDLYHEKGEGEEKSSHVVHEMMGTI
jgi:hypothetical protein